MHPIPKYISGMEQDQITFDPVPHTYTGKKVKQYVSATTYLKDYYSGFDEKYWAKKETEKTGETVAQVLKRWHTTRDLACEKGNIVHNDIETGIDALSGIVKTRGKEKIAGIVDPFKVKITTISELDKWAVSNLYKNHFPIYHRLLKLIQDGWTIFTEKRIYSVVHQICGTIDLLAIKGKQCIILDWKTNKDELKFIAGYYKKDRNGVKTDEFVETGNTCFYPIRHLPDCKGYHYALQVSLYARLCEYWGYELIDIALCHIKCDYINGVVGNYEHKWINIPYLPKEIDAMLEHRIEVLKSPLKKKTLFGYK